MRIGIQKKHHGLEQNIELKCLHFAKSVKISSNIKIKINICLSVLQYKYDYFTIKNI